MSANLNPICLTACVEDEERAYRLANTLLSQELTQSPYQNTTWRKKVAYGVGVALSVLWLALGSLLALSRNKTQTVDLTPPPIIENYNLDHLPKYVSTDKTHLIP